MLQFTIHNSQFSMNDQLSINNSSAKQIQPLTIVNCQLKTAIDRKEMA